MLRRRLSIAALALLPALAFAQAGRVPTVTRLVKLFLDLEGTLLDAARSGDRAALERQLADDFEMRVAQRPGEPVPRADWLAHTLAARPPAAQIEQMAVHDEGQAALVSFLLRPQGTQQWPTFVVDTWVRAGDEWRLQVRYAAPVPAHSPRVAGEGSASTPAIPKRY